MLTYRSSIVKYIGRGRNGTNRTGKEAETEKEKGRESIKIREGIFFHQNNMKLEISHRWKNRKRTNTWRLSNNLLKNPISNNETKQGYQKITRGKLKWKATFQNLWYAAKVILKGKFTVMKSLYKKQENLTESKLPSERIRKRRRMETIKTREKIIKIEIENNRKDQ